MLHAGDFSNTGKLGEVVKFGAFMRALPHKHKIVIAVSVKFRVSPCRLLPVARPLALASQWVCWETLVDPAWKTTRRLRWSARYCLQGNHDLSFDRLSYPTTGPRFGHEPLVESSEALVGNVHI